MRLRVLSLPPRFVASFPLPSTVSPFGRDTRDARGRKRRAPLSAPLREDINRGILNRFEDRDPRKKRRNLLSPSSKPLSFLFRRDDARHCRPPSCSSPALVQSDACCIESTSKSFERGSIVHNCSGSSFLTRRHE